MPLVGLIHLALTSLRSGKNSEEVWGREGEGVRKDYRKNHSHI